MRVDRKHLILGVVLAGAMSVSFAGCGSFTDASAAPKANTTVGAPKFRSELPDDPRLKSFDQRVKEQCPVLC